MEKQQIRKRSARLRGPSTRPAVMPSLVSNEKQRVAGSRPPAVVAAKAAPEEFVSRDALLEAPARRTIRIFASALRVLLRPIRRGPLVPATAALTLIVGAIAITVSGGPSIHGSAAPPLTLPPDPQIASLLASYAQPSEADKPVEAVQLPTPHILEALKTRSVTVGRGDTISSIAAAAGLSIETLISFNSVSDVRLLTVGTVLKVPSMNGTLYTVRPGDNLERIAVSNGVKLNNILDANGLKSAVIVPGQELFLPGAHMSLFAYRKALGTLFEWPTIGVITSPFGMRQDPFTGIAEFHNGIDIANVMGTPVRAAMDGKVAMVGSNRGYGNFIILNNGNGYQTLYGHLSKWLVQQGESVQAGQEIGRMGSTGYATGPHLHFTIYKNSAPVNPLTYLPKR